MLAALIWTQQSLAQRSDRDPSNLHIERYCAIGNSMLKSLAESCKFSTGGTARFRSPASRQGPADVKLDDDFFPAVLAVEQKENHLPSGMFPSRLSREWD